MREIGKSSADPLELIDRPVVLLEKTYKSGDLAEWHRHSRGQFLYATQGLMKARTSLGAWIVPSGFGLFIPHAIEHEVEMFGDVSMQSSYIHPGILSRAVSKNCKVIKITPLLKESVDRFATRPAAYTDDDIAVSLTRIIVSEIKNSPASAMILPFNHPSRLSKMWQILLRNPSDSRSIDSWASTLNMSRRTFTRSVRKETGLSFSQWRQRLRFHKASELIASGKTLPQVAHEVGYQNVSSLKSMMARMI